MIDRKGIMFNRMRVVVGMTTLITLPTAAEALTMGRMEVKSSVNEPFRGKIPLKNINVTLNNIKVSTAGIKDYKRLGMYKANVSLTYNIQDNGDGTGTLWVSSSKPIKQPYLDLVINMNTPTDKSVHQVSALINPKNNLIDVPEEPENSGLAKNETPLVPSSAKPPAMPSIDLPQITKLQPTQIKKPVIDPIVINNEERVTDFTPFTGQSKRNVDLPKPNNKPSRQTKVNTANVAKGPKYRVVKRDTLWDIAHRISKQKGMPIHEVMNQIQALNRQAFVNNNKSKLRAGVTLTLPSDTDVSLLNRPKKTQLAKSQPKPAKQKKKTHTAKKYRKPIQTKSKIKPKQKPKRIKARKAPVKSKKRLSKAEMRIVSPALTGSAQGEKKVQKSSTGASSKLPPQIASQVKKSRAATIKRRKRINKLNVELSSYSKKIKLQNQKLADLEKRLKQLNAKKSS